MSRLSAIREPITDSVPDAVLAAFKGKATLTIPELIQVIRMDAKTLRAHHRNGDLECCQKGFGQKRPRRVVTLAQVARFYSILAARGSACLSTKPPSRDLGSTIFSREL